MTDLQILILTLFLGLFGLLINYLVKFFRCAVKSVEESKENENSDAIEVSNQAVVKIVSSTYILNCLSKQINNKFV